MFALMGRFIRQMMPERKKPTNRVARSIRARQPREIRAEKPPAFGKRSKVTKTR